VTYNSFLFCRTGGLAYGGVRSSATNIFTPGTAGTFAGRASNTLAGWVAGAGVEWGFAPNWTVKGEYLHIDLGHSNVTMAHPVHFPISFAAFRFHHELYTVRVGVNYRFGGPIVARY
jgi:outer membrane immunogenic protein